MSGFDNEVVYADNVDFSGGSPISGKIQTDGQLLIGSTSLNAGGTHINVGEIVSESDSLVVSYSNPNITLELGFPNLFFVKKTITSQQVKNLHATPIEIIPAPGAGKYITVFSGQGYLNYAGTNAFVNGAGANIGLYYGTSQFITFSLLSSADITSTVSILRQYQVGGVGGNISLFDNMAVNAYYPNATEISGNAADDNTIVVTCFYYITTL